MESFPAKKKFPAEKNELPQVGERTDILNEQGALLLDRVSVGDFLNIQTGEGDYIYKFFVEDINASTIFVKAIESPNTRLVALNERHTISISTPQMPFGPNRMGLMLSDGNVITRPIKAAYSTDTPPENIRMVDGSPEQEGFLSVERVSMETVRSGDVIRLSLLGGNRLELQVVGLQENEKVVKVTVVQAESVGESKAIFLPRDLDICKGEKLITYLYPLDVPLMSRDEWRELLNSLPPSLKTEGGINAVNAIELGRTHPVADAEQPAPL